MNHQMIEIEPQCADASADISELELAAVLGGNASDVSGVEQASIVGRVGSWIITAIAKDMLFGSGTRGPTVPSNPSTGAHGQGGQGSSRGGGGGSGGASGR